jgi:predicted Co/Zn/Cd cation transporter (cation efflux family)
MIGVALAVVSLLVMPLLSWAQRRTGRALASGSVVADSRWWSLEVTAPCALVPQVSILIHVETNSTDRPDRTVLYAPGARAAD